MKKIILQIWQKPTNKITKREVEVITLTAYGKTRGEISEILGISKETVKAHIEQVCRKLSANNKTHAAIIALSLGLIKPSFFKPAENQVRENNKNIPQKGNIPQSTGSLLIDSGAISVKRKRRAPSK